MLFTYSFEHLQTGLQYFENWSLRSILSQVLKQHSDYKRFIAKTFGGNALKMKAVSAIQARKIIKQFFLLYLDQKCALVLNTLFLRARSGAQAKLGAKKSDVYLERNLSTMFTRAKFGSLSILSLKEFSITPITTMPLTKNFSQFIKFTVPGKPF